MDGSRPIIIVKKKGGHGGHHGGAWKVAYADFVTAMMALFIVLWLLNTNKPVREAVAGYFKDPPEPPTRSVLLRWALQRPSPLPKTTCRS
jgi:flagellar motor protein MotB